MAPSKYPLHHGMTYRSFCHKSLKALYDLKPFVTNSLLESWLFCILSDLCFAQTYLLFLSSCEADNIHSSRHFPFNFSDHGHGQQVRAFLPVSLKVHLLFVLFVNWCNICFTTAAFGCSIFLPGDWNNKRAGKGLTIALGKHPTESLCTWIESFPKD